MGFSALDRHRELLLSAADDLMRRRGPAAVTVLCLTAILLPLLTALAISEGLRSQAEIGIREGPDLFIAADVGGAEGPLGAAHLERLRRVPGIVQAQARVVGRTYFGDHLVAVVGLEPASLQALKPLVTGRVPRSRGEVLLGRGLAREFGIDPGAAVPFSLAANRKKMLRVTGTLKPCCLWASRILLMDIADANEFFRLPGRSTQLLARRSPESGISLKEAVEKLGDLGAGGPAALRAVDKEQLIDRLGSGYDRRGGIFIVLYVVGAILVMPAFLVTSGLGRKESAREIGVQSALGWSARQILEKLALEKVLISLMSVSLAILLSMAWMKVFNGFFIAQFFVAEIGMLPQVPIPCRYLPSHALSGLLLALAVTLGGGLVPAWKKTLELPRELM